MPWVGQIEYCNNNQYSVDCPINTFMLIDPFAVYGDSAGSIYISDNSACRIIKVSAEFVVIIFMLVTDLIRSGQLCH